MRPLALMIGLLGVVMLPWQCSAQIMDNPFAEYFERSITIAPERRQREGHQRGNPYDRSVAALCGPYTHFPGRPIGRERGGADAQELSDLSASSVNQQRYCRRRRRRRRQQRRRCDGWLRTGTRAVRSGLGRGSAAPAAAPPLLALLLALLLRLPYWRPLEPRRRIDSMSETTTRIYQITEIFSSVPFSARTIAMPVMITTITAEDICSAGGSGA